MATFQNLSDLAAALHQASLAQDKQTFMALLQANVSPPPEQPNPVPTSGPSVGLQTLLKPRLELPKPEFFSGADNRPPLVRTWLAQLRRYFKLWPTLADSDKINYAVNLLRSHAMHWWEGQEQLVRIGQSEELDSFEQFEEAITKQFGGFDVTERARDMLANIRQLSSVETYVRRYREALLLLGADNYLDADMCHRFILGLKPWVQRLVKIEAPKTLEDAMQVASRIDRVRVTAPDRRTYSDPRPGPSETSEATPMEIGAIQAGRSRFRKLTEAEKKRLQETNGCFYCRKPNAGHSSRDCPEKLKSQGRQ